MANCTTPAPVASPIYIPPPTANYSCDCGYGCTAQVGPCDWWCTNCGDVPFEQT